MTGRAEFPRGVSLEIAYDSSVNTVEWRRRELSLGWISWVNVALGVWLVVAAFAFSHPAGSGVIEDLIAGLFVALSALWAARAFRPRVSLVASWTVVLSGLWVVAAPFALAYAREAAGVINDVVIGLAIVVLGIVNVSAKNRRLVGGQPFGGRSRK
jgi:uncharacterized membrane protein HdeD (DUF308 family)